MVPRCAKIKEHLKATAKAAMSPHIGGYQKKPNLVRQKEANYPKEARAPTR